MLSEVTRVPGTRASLDVPETFLSGSGGALLVINIRHVFPTLERNFASSDNMRSATDALFRRIVLEE